jgi:hypothetical protein
MGILFKLSDVFQKFDYQTSIDYHTSRLPEISGRAFEDHVLSLFSPGNFKLKKKTIFLKRILKGTLKAVKNLILFLNISRHGKYLQSGANIRQN